MDVSGQRQALFGWRFFFFFWMKFFILIIISFLVINILPFSCFLACPLSFSLMFDWAVLTFHWVCILHQKLGLYKQNNWHSSLSLCTQKIGKKMCPVRNKKWFCILFFVFLFIKKNEQRTRSKNWKTSVKLEFTIGKNRKKYISLIIILSSLTMAK